MDGAAPAARFSATDRPALAGVRDDRARRGMVDSHAGPWRQRAHRVSGGVADWDDSVKDYGSYSFWLETSADDLTPRPRLDESIDVDVAVMGAGYTGLWTAYYLLRREPSLRVAVVERQIAGFGASGRNGGWCYPGFPVSLSLLRERYGTEAARAVYRAMVET